MVPGRKKISGLQLIHFLWASAALILAGVIIASDGGHPPAILFLPLLVGAWFFGHAALWGLGRLEARGRRRAGGAASWPPGLIAALIGTGLLAAVGVVQVAGTVIAGQRYPFASPLWEIGMAIFLVHGMVLGGLLLRARWARIGCGALAAGWVILGLLQIYQQSAHGHRIMWDELLTLVAGIAVMAAFGGHLLLSRRIKAFLDC